MCFQNFHHTFSILAAIHLFTRSVTKSKISTSPVKKLVTATLGVCVSLHLSSLCSYKIILQLFLLLPLPPSLTLPHNQTPSIPCIYQNITPMLHLYKIIKNHIFVLTSTHKDGIINLMVITDYVCHPHGTISCYNPENSCLNSWTSFLDHIKLDLKNVKKL